MSDPQQQRLYSAESVPMTPTMTTVAEFQAYVDKVLGRAYLRRTYGSRLPRRITVKDGRRRRSACATYTWSGYEISAPRWSRSEQTALHEIAHCVSGTSKGGDHGPEFAKVYLDLVRHMLGAEKAAKMQVRFRVHKVRVNDKNGNPRLPIVPPALREYAAELEESLRREKRWESVQRDWLARFYLAAEAGHEIDCITCGEWAKAELRTSSWRRMTNMEAEAHCPNGHWLHEFKRARR